MLFVHFNDLKRIFTYHLGKLCRSAACTVTEFKWMQEYSRANPKLVPLRSKWDFFVQIEMSACTSKYLHVRARTLRRCCDSRGIYTERQLSPRPVARATFAKLFILLRNTKVSWDIGDLRDQVEFILLFSEISDQQPIKTRCAWRDTKRESA